MNLLRDTNHSFEPIGVCDDLQAGYEDGTYLKTIHEALKNQNRIQKNPLSFQNINNFQSFCLMMFNGS